MLNLILSQTVEMKNSEKQNGSHYLVIDGKQTVMGLQKEFNRHFPFLKIEFIRDRMSKSSRQQKPVRVPPAELICEVVNKKIAGKIAFNADTTVHDLENTFLADYGLYVQVFRKSGNIWLVTTSTDDWTLEQQNEEARSLAQHFKIEAEVPEDHDIY